MRSDHDIDFPSLERREGLGLLRLRDEPRQDFDSQWVVIESSRERPVVLLRQNGGRAEHCDLPTAHGDPERRPQSDLRLAEAHVAADQAIHWPAFV